MQADARKPRTRIWVWLARAGAGVPGLLSQPAALPAEGLAAPGWMAGIHWSDHGPFWREGYPAIMVTDTALFRYAHYPAQTDTPDKIDYERLARVVAGLAGVTRDLGRDAE